MIKIYVVVEGGCVRYVSSDLADAEVVVVDLDDLADDPYPREHASLEAAGPCPESGNHLWHLCASNAQGDHRISGPWHRGKEGTPAGMSWRFIVRDNVSFISGTPRQWKFFDVTLVHDELQNLPQNPRFPPDAVCRALCGHVQYRGDFILLSRRPPEERSRSGQHHLLRRLRRRRPGRDNAARRREVAGRVEEGIGR